MKRYYLCDVVENPDEPGFFEPVIWQYPGLNTSVEITADRQHALVIVATINHSQLLSDPRIQALPDFPLDGKINAMQAAAKNKMVSDMASRGFATGLISSADGFRDVIRGIGQQINPNFNENNFDVSE